MSILGYYVGPNVDTALGDGDLLCYPWCYDEWADALIDSLIDDPLVEFGFRPSLTLEQIRAKVHRQSVALTDTEEMDARPVCDWCLARAVSNKTTDSLVPLAVRLTEHGRIYEGAQQIDDAWVKRCWKGTEPERKPGQLDPYAWPGGYPLLYLVQTDTRYGLANETFEMCAPCATESITEHLDEYRIIGVQTYDEGPAIECDGWCGELIESSYGDPSDESEDAQ